MSKYAIRGRLRRDDYSWRVIQNESFPKLILRLGVQDFSDYPSLEENLYSATPLWLQRLGVSPDNGNVVFSAECFPEGVEVIFDATEEEQLDSLGDDELQFLSENYLEDVSIGEHECTGQKYLYQQWSDDTNWGRILIETSMTKTEIESSVQDNLSALLPFPSMKEHIISQETVSWESGDWEPRVISWIGCGNCDPTNQSDFDYDNRGGSWGAGSCSPISTSELLDALTLISMQNWTENEIELISEAFSNLWEEEGHSEEFSNIVDAIHHLVSNFKDENLAAAIVEEIK